MRLIIQEISRKQFKMLRFKGCLRITQDYRFFRFGDEIEWRSISEDGINFYLNGWNDDYLPGISANYLVLPKYAAVKMEEK